MPSHWLVQVFKNGDKFFRGEGLGFRVCMGMVRVEAESYAKIVCFAKKFDLM